VIDVGDLVVAVDCDCGDHAFEMPSALLVIGRAYRVRKISPKETYYGECPCGVHLAEIPDRGPLDSGFCGARFRKLKDSADDAELIERIKSCQPEKVRA
jgi:hypothetical protein